MPPCPSMIPLPTELLLMLRRLQSIQRNGRTMTTTNGKAAEKTGRGLGRPPLATPTGAAAAEVGAGIDGAGVAAGAAIVAGGIVLGPAPTTVVVGVVAGTGTGVAAIPGSAALGGTTAPMRAGAMAGADAAAAAANALAWPP